MTIEINTVHRQDFFMRIYDMLFNVRDLVTIQIALDNHSGDTPLFAMLAKGKQEGFRTANKVFKEYAPQVNPAGFPNDTLITLCESAEAARELLLAAGKDRIISVYLV